MKNIIIVSVTTLVIGFFLGNVVFSRSFIKNEISDMSMSGMQHTMSDGTVMGGSQPAMSGMMMDMTAGLKGKTGDDFDKEFLAEMVVHHQGAVDMAQLALKNAKHQEIKNLATAIIEAQNKEIAQMKAWYKAWYGMELKVN